VANQHVLLLSATPIHNRPRDLHNLLALFLGNRADLLDYNALAQYIVRRTPTAIASQSIPVVREHAPYVVPANPPVLEQLLTLPAPLPARNGAAAGALIRLGLLQAWCSSDAALSDSLRRRQLRGEALLHSLAHGRYPTQRELQSWVAGNDCIQLGFPELLASTTSTDTAALVKTLSAHLDALQRLLQLHTYSSVADPERAAILRALLKPSSQHSAHAPPLSPPVIAFSHFASTVRALHRALGDLAGVASLTSHGGRIASGNITRQELIAQFAPRAHGRPPPPAHQAIQLLLTTDLLAEGVNLQDAGTLVHLDLPWTDAARAQRVGRLARLGAQHETVNVFTFAPPPGIEATLRIAATLKRKAGIAESVVGAGAAAPASPPGGKGAPESAPEFATRLHNRLKSWSAFQGRHSKQLQVARINSNTSGWISLVTQGNSPHVIVRLAATIESTSAQLLKAIDEIRGDIGAATQPINRSVESLVREALSSLDEWVSNRQLNLLAGPSSRSLSPAHKIALRAIAQCVAATPAVTRASIAAAAAHAEVITLASRGAGTESALEQWCALRSTLSPRQWLDAITRFPALSTNRSATGRGSSEQPYSVQALLLLSAGEPLQRYG
jgi:superfamily II DNA/RNA helicase